MPAITFVFLRFWLELPARVLMSFVSASTDAAFHRQVPVRAGRQSVLDVFWLVVGFHRLLHFHVVGFVQLQCVSA